MKTEQMPVLSLSGAPRQRGRDHGEALRTKIPAILDIWRQTTALPANLSFGAFIDRLLNETTLVQTLRRHCPDIYEEALGIAEGAGLDPSLILAFQLGDEARWFLRDRVLAVARDNDRCTAIGQMGGKNSTTVIGENVDIGSWADGFQVVLVHAASDDAPAALIFTVAGMVGINGVNEAGVAVCCNTLLQLDPNPAGLSVTGVVRTVLKKRSYAEAARFLRAVDHASGQNYLLGGHHEAGSFECSGRSVAELMAAQGRVLHTNHPLVNKDTSAYNRALANAAIAGAEVLEENSRTRLRCLASRVDQATAALNVEAIKTILRSRDDASYPICRSTEIEATEPYWFTAASTIFDLDHRPTLHIAAGPPNECDFRALTFD